MILNALQRLEGRMAALEEKNSSDKMEKLEIEVAQFKMQANISKATAERALKSVNTTAEKKVDMLTKIVF